MPCPRSYLPSRLGLFPAHLRPLLLALAFALAPGRPVHAVPAAQDIEVDKYRLANGLTVILYEDHSAPQACVNLWYGVGSKDEREGRSGFAHLFEHLMFMGTERVPEGRFDAIMEAGGGFNNASTSPDRTNYFDVGPAELLPTLLWLEADRLEDLSQSMTVAKLDLQRDVVLNERRQSYENAPYGQSRLVIHELMFPPGHPYHHTTIGSVEDLKAATVEDVVDFFDAYYVPNNASLVVAGDFDPGAVKPLVERLFGSLPTGAKVVHRTAEPVTLEREVRRTLRDDVQFPRVTFVYHGPAYFAPGDAELDLLAGVLAEGINSRLYRRLVTGEELCVDVSARQLSMMLGSLFAVEATLRPEVSFERVEAELDAVLRELIEAGPEVDELARQKTRVEFESAARLGDLLSRADKLNEYEFFFGEPLSFERDRDRYRDATVKGVRQVAESVLGSGHRLVLRVVPRGEDEPVNPRDERPAIPGPAPFEPPAPATLTLASGVTAHHWERSDVPLVRVALALDSGAAWDGDRAGLAYLTAEMLDEGAGGLSAAAFQGELERLGATLEVEVEHEHTRLVLACLAGALGPALELAAEAVRRPSFERSEWERVFGLHAQELLADQDDPSLVAERAARRAFFGDGHPYGWPVEGTADSVRRVELEDVRAFHARHYRPSRLTILAAGDVSAAELEGHLGAAFGDWAEPDVLFPPAPEFPAPAADATGLRVAVVDRPGAVQTVVRFVLPAPAHGDGGRLRREVLGTLLGGSFTSRLNANLRERHGYTYGARCRFQSEPSAGWFSAWAAVRADVTGPAVREFLFELERLRAGDVGPEEAAKGRAQRRFRMVIQQADAERLLEWAADAVQRGEGFGQWAADYEQLGTIDAGELNAHARAALPLERGLLLLVGDRALVERQLAPLDLAASPREVAVTGERIPAKMR